jgi:peroxiredoxin
VVITVSQNLDALIEQAKEQWFERFVAGPKRLRWNELPPQIGEPAPDLEIQDSTGTWRQLSEFWAEGPALLLFWRHFGCSCGIDRAEELAHEYDEYVQAGATVAIVGEGEPERAAEYADEYEIDCPVLCDPDGTAHETYGLLDFTLPQIWYPLPPESFQRYRTAADEFAEEFAEDYKVDGREKVDNPWRQPGEFVIDGDGVLQLTYRYQYCEDFPDHRVLTTVIREAA